MILIGANDSHVRGVKPMARVEPQAGWEEVVNNKLDFLFDYAGENNATIMHAGDLFDTPREWLALSMVARAFGRAAATIYGIPGQHDLYMRNVEATTSWNILEQFGIINRPENPTSLYDEVNDVWLHIYGAGWGEEVPVPNGPKRLSGHQYNALLIHAPISIRPLYPDHDFTQAAYFAKKWAQHYDLIFCGDCHLPFYERVPKNNHHDCHIMNSGPMLRLDATEDSFNHKPGFWVVNLRGLGVEVEWVGIPHEEGVLSRDHLDKAEQAAVNMEAFVKAVAEEDKLKVVDIRSEVQTLAKQISSKAQYMLSLVMEEVDDGKA